MILLPQHGNPTSNKGAEILSITSMILNVIFEDEFSRPSVKS